MGQIVIRNLDDELVADYREAAKRNRRSMEAEVREALRIMRPKSPQVGRNAGAAIRTSSTMIRLMVGHAARRPVRLLES